MKNKVVVVVSVLLTGLEVSALTLAERNHPPSTTIVIPADAEPVERYAAEELRNWTERLTGVSLPIVSGEVSGTSIRLARVDDPQLGTDGFRLRVSNGKVEVSGGVRGVLYGVYELLETYGGIGWFASFSSYVPRTDSFSVPDELERTEKPAFAVRDQFFYDANHHGDFAARLRLNFGYGGFGLKERHGGKAFADVPLPGHSFAYLVPLEKYGKTHPEYFALRGGFRRVEGDAQRVTQPCLTNPDVLEIATTNLFEVIGRFPKAFYYPIGCNDNANFCQCPKCAAVDAEEGSHAGSYVRFVNALADRVAVAFPGKFLRAHAYTFTRKPTKTAYRKNILLEICSVEPDNAYPIKLSKCPQSASFRELMEGWKSKAGKLMIWSYVTDFNAYTTPFPNIPVLREDLRYYRDVGVWLMSPQGPYGGYGGDLQELKSWLLAKWQWNPDAPLEPLLDRFMKGHYGPAAPFARSYFDKLHRLVPPDKGVKLLGNYGNACNTALVTDEFLAEARDLWRKAALAVKGDPMRERAVRLSALGTEVTLFNRQLGSPEPIKFTIRRLQPEKADDFKSLVATAKGIAEVLKIENRVRLCDGASTELMDRICRIAEGRTPLSCVFEPRDSITFGPDDLGLYFGIDGAYGSLLLDSTALKGKAVRLSNRGRDWVVHLPLPKLAFDPGVDYRVRVRVKVEKKPDGPGYLQAFSCGISDATKSGNGGVKSVSVEEAKDGGWHWYDVITFKTASGLKFWLASGGFDMKKYKEHPSIKAVYFDSVEISRVLDR